MRPTPQIISAELIGTEAKVYGSTNSDMARLSGRVINETRNTLTIISRKNKSVIIPKNTSVFHFKFSDGSVFEINGGLLVGRPEDRLRKNIRRLW